MSFSEFKCEAWFLVWLKNHMVLHPGKWLQADDPAFVTFFDGWKSAFDRWRMTEAEAKACSKLMQESGCVYQEKTLPALKSALYTVRERARKVAANPTIDPTADREFLEAFRASDGCPECTDSTRKPTGYAKRPWYSPKLPFPIHAEILCRCPLGRYHRDRDPWRKGEQPDKPYPECADLQAYPHLWDESKRHWTFSTVPSRPDFPTDLEDGFYVRHDDPRVVHVQTRRASDLAATVDRKQSLDRLTWIERANHAAALKRHESADRPKSTPTTGIPCGLPPGQEIFLDWIGSDLRAGFNVLSKDDQTTVLGLIGTVDLPTDDQVKAAKDRLVQLIEAFSTV